MKMHVIWGWEIYFLSGLEIEWLWLHLFVSCKLCWQAFCIYLRFAEHFFFSRYVWLLLVFFIFQYWDLISVQYHVHYTENCAIFNDASKLKSRVKSGSISPLKSLFQNLKWISRINLMPLVYVMGTFSRWFLVYFFNLTWIKEILI